MENKECIFLNKKYSSKDYKIILENDPHTQLQWFAIVKRKEQPYNNYKKE